MIQEFSVQNFLSIRDKQTISFVATKDKHLLDELTVEVKPNLRLLRMAMIFGANASGKSNLMSAMYALWELLFYTKHETGQKIETYLPFALTKSEPIRMSCIFWAMEQRYHYDIEYNQNEILYEKLQYTTSNDVLSLVYERKKNEDIKFGSTIDIKAQERNDLNRETLQNHTVISTFAKKKIKVPILQDLHNWINTHICGKREYNNGLEIALEADSKPDLKALILELMREADFNIKDFEIIGTALSPEIIDKIKSNSNLSEKQKDIFLAQRQQLIFKHKTAETEYFIDFGMESAGTQSYFRLSRLLFNLKNSEYVFIEDELDKSLHYELLIHYLQTFLQTPSHSQLIFSTHDLLLLDESWMMRRDMVYLTERDKETGNTQLSRVSDMGLHKNMSVLNAYRIGKLGGKPRLGSTFL